jgi:Protein of unknown function (DUF3641)
MSPMLTLRRHQRQEPQRWTGAGGVSAHRDSTYAGLLRRTFAVELAEADGIRFDALYCITHMPISRFQMLELPLEARAPRHVREADLERLLARDIRVGRHCFGCIAGAGSSCGGATT